MIALSLLLAAASAPAHPAVQWQGCATYRSASGSTIAADNILYVFFAVGSAHLDRKARSLLDMYVRNFEAQPGCKVAVDGASDMQERGGVKLSWARADAVARYLETKSLAAPVWATGLGSTRPLVGDTGGKPERQNRNVEVYVSE